MWLEEGDGEDGWLRQYGWVEELLHYAGTNAFASFNLRLDAKS